MQLGIYKCGGQIYKLWWEMYEYDGRCNHVLWLFASKLCDIQMHEEIDKCTISLRQYLSVVVSPMAAPASKFSVH